MSLLLKFHLEVSKTKLAAWNTAQCVLRLQSFGYSQLLLSPYDALLVVLVLLSHIAIKAGLEIACKIFFLNRLPSNRGRRQPWILFPLYETGISVHTCWLKHSYSKPEQMADSLCVETPQGQHFKHSDLPLIRHCHRFRRTWCSFVFQNNISSLKNTSKQFLRCPKRLSDDPEDSELHYGIFFVVIPVTILIILVCLFNQR